MSNKGQANPIVRVRPGLGKPRSTAAQMVATTQSSIAAMKASPDWPSAAAVQTAVTSWNTAANGVASNLATIAQLKDQLRAAVVNQRSLQQTWSVCTKQVLVNVDAFCANSPTKIQGFGLVAVTQTAHALIAAPIDIATSPGPLPGELRVTWPRALASHGFVLQHATDTTNPATMSPSMPWSKTKYTYSGAPSGSSVFFRVAAIDPHAATGQSPWSAWVSGTVK